MTVAPSCERINIRPGVSVLSVLRHLKYQPWFALAEFVDNSLQSYFERRDELLRLEGFNFKLAVSITLDTSDAGRIIIRDNAGGISEKDYSRAFRPAAIPPNRTGLAEFGMGMKSAACWFSPHWSVRTSALGESVARTVTFDIDAIIRDEIEELTIETVPADPTIHFTEITLHDLHQVPQGRTVGKIKEHLADIYRVFTRNGSLDLRFNREQLRYEEPAILTARYFKDETGERRVWRKEIDFDFGNGLRASGFAALRETGSTSRAGFALFRRNRLIQGSGDEGYRPAYVFGGPNKYAYQRLFGELHLEGFDVSHTKDGFRWEENEETFLELLHEELERSDLPLLSQAEGYRARGHRNEMNTAAAQATERTAEVIRDEVPPVLNQLDQRQPAEHIEQELTRATQAAQRVIEVELRGQQWRIDIELTDDPAVSDWVEVSDRPASNNRASIRHLGLRMSLTHPFTERFGGRDGEHIEALLRIAAAIGLAETAARDAGVRMAGTIRHNINELLRNALAKP